MPHIMRRFYSKIVRNHLEEYKKDLPKRAGPFTYYIRVIFTLQLQPARRLTDVVYQRVTELT